MLIALPNPDGSFTATLFLPRAGATSFETLRVAGGGARLFRARVSRRAGADAGPGRAVPAQSAGPLGTLHCALARDGRLLLIGDAAHAIVPFHGQGMNCGFEDCVAARRAAATAASDWPTAFADFEATRRPNADAIAQMALENYVEMRDTVLDPGFLRQKRWRWQLERRHPRRFIPRYSMVMFHPEIPYAEAQRRGALQEQILDELDPGRRRLSRAGLRPCPRRRAGAP